MTEKFLGLGVPAPENALRELAKNVLKALPRFAEEQPEDGVKKLYVVLNPVLETADLPGLTLGHRAAASNALCAIVEACQASTAEYARHAILDDSIWLRLFNIYLDRSDEAKGKSMRQLLLLLTSVVTKDQSQRACVLREQAASVFLNIICVRQDRVKVKPALQGLAHFLLRDAISIAQLLRLHAELPGSPSRKAEDISSWQGLFKAFLAWIVHHDTSLSAGHLVKNFLLQARKLPEYSAPVDATPISPLWIEPVISMLRDWPDRMQEFKTHVFPHCFLPHIKEYVRFLSYIHIGFHVRPRGTFPGSLRIFENHANGLSGAEEFQILLAALETGKELTILHDKDFRTNPSISVHDDSIHIPDDIFGAWMSQLHPEVRLAGMFLSVYSTSVTRALTSGSLISLRSNVVHLHTDTDANFRREVHGYTQKLFDRLRASTATLSKSVTKSKATNGDRAIFPLASFGHGKSLNQLRQDSLLESLTFVVSYIRFLESELRSAASYQRRITALQSLTIVLRSGVDPGIPHSYLSKSAQGQLHWAQGLQIANPKLVRLLLDLIVDPFDDVRGMAVSVLQLCLLALPTAEMEAMLSAIPKFLARAEITMLRTGRADQADGVARSYSLLFSLGDHTQHSTDDSQLLSSLQVFEQLENQLKTTLDVAHSNLADAVDGRPVHGTFSALRYIVDHESFYPAVKTCPDEIFSGYKKAHDKIIADIESLWVCVQDVLCADAPEGHVPDEMEEEASLDTKEILSYSWRGVKEASVLLRTIVLKAPVGEEERALISPATFERLGQLCFTQLLDLRHRGAFSTVSQTFAAFCRRCISSDVPTVRALPDTWYLDTLSSIQAKAGAITRRSAGIPALMAGIIAADPKLFSRAMIDLTSEAQIEAESMNIEESRLPQVHALNCIKEFFTSSRLAVSSEPYMGAGLELAAKTLNSNIWPIRNCSLMLFKALIERLLGSDEAQDWKERERTKTSRFSFDKYPSLVGILTDLLNPEGPLKQSIEQAPDSGSPLDLHGAEGVFPALQILRQARPPEAALEPIITSVEKLLGSPHWHLREMAARTIVALRPVQQLSTAALDLLNISHDAHNLRHGRLLAVKYMLSRWLNKQRGLNNEELTTLMERLGGFAKSWYTNSHCPFIRTAFLDIVSSCGMALLRIPDVTSVIPAWEYLTHAVSIGPEYALGSISQIGDALYKQAIAHAYFIDRVILRDGILDVLVNRNYQGIGEALIKIANEDPDTCCGSLETLDKVLKLNPSNCSTVPLDLLMAHIHSVIVNCTDLEVLSKAQAVLADNLTDSHLRSAFFALITEEQALLTLAKLESQCLNGPPSNMQNALRLQGFFLDFAFSTYPAQRDTILKTIARYIRLLRMTIIDTNPFDMRFAAVQSVCALDHILKASPTSKSTSPLLLGLTFVLYDLLNDDDDEIRDAAALATSTLLRAQTGTPNLKATVPLLSTHRLAKYLSKPFSTSRYLPTETLRRLTNTPSPTPLFSTPFATTLTQQRKEDTALFATEKQNLYKDDTLDAILWSRVLIALPRSSSVPHNLREGLKTWVLDALDVLTRTARMERDGALGWSSKPEVFTLGIRVVCGAEVVLAWSGGAGGGGGGGSGGRGQVMQKLRAFVDAGREGEVHGLWIERIERVLEREVVGMMRRVRESLDGVVG